MKITTIPGTTLQVSNICIGGGNFGAKLNQQQAFEILDAFYAAGGNFIDTANVYCRWIEDTNSSEQYIGEWLRSRNAKSNVIIATKGGHYHLKTPSISRINKEEVLKDLEESLKTLGLECIPFYWLHRDNPSLPVEEIIDFCEEFVRAGKILYYGASNWTLERIQHAREVAHKKGYQGFSAVSNQYSLAYIEPGCNMNSDPSLAMTDAAFLKWHRETQMPLIPYTSIANGFYEKLNCLQPTVRGGELLTDNLNLREDFKKAYINKVNLQRYEYMLKLKEQYGYSMIDLSVAYLTNQSFPVIPAISVRGTDQLQAVIHGADVTLPTEVLETLLNMEM